MRSIALAAAAALAVTGCANMGGRPGAELVNHALRIEAPNRPVTVLTFAADGTVTGNANGNRANGRWEIVERQICITFERMGRECFPYAGPFRSGQTVTLTGTSGVTVRATLQ